MFRPESGEAPAAGAHPLVFALTLAALLVGIVVRFKGLGAWPLEVDEYYSARAIEDILRTGLPAFDCGGYYERGLIFHYLAALLQLAGLSPELAPRTVSAVSSLLTLPAVFILGKRTHSVTVGLLAVAVLSLSIWEIELARYGRMYAPFQALFVWYAIFFQKYAIDRDARAFWPIIGLTILGFLIWEGGVLLACANLLLPILKDPSGRWSRREWLQIGLSVAMILIIYESLNVGWRLIGQPPPWPEGLDAAMSVRLETMHTVAELQFSRYAIFSHPAWLAVALVPIATAAWAIPWIWSLRSRWLAAIGLLIALFAALTHQFLLAGSVLLLLLMLRIVRTSEIAHRRARSYQLALIFSLVFWIAYGLLTDEWTAGADAAWLGNSRLVAVAYELLRFPNFVLEVARPWSNAEPLLGLLLLALIAVAVVRSISVDKDHLTAERVLQVLLVALLLAASATSPPRHETRYVFFLYPLALIVALTLIARASDKMSSQARTRAVLAMLVGLAGFAITEDFRPQRMMNVADPSVGLRLGSVRGKASQFIPRVDVRSAAAWLSHVSDERAMFINAFPSVDFYFDQFNFSYVDWKSKRFVGYACRGATVERWSNLPLLYTVEALESQIASGRPVYLAISSTDTREFLRRLWHWKPRVVWRSADGELSIATFGASK